MQVVELDMAVPVLLLESDDEILTALLLGRLERDDDSCNGIRLDRRGIHRRRSHLHVLLLRGSLQSHCCRVELPDLAVVTVLDFEYQERVSEQTVLVPRADEHPRLLVRLAALA